MKLKRFFGFAAAVAVFAFAIVTCDGFDIDGATIVNITIVPPDNTNYSLGSSDFDLTGLVVTVYWSDGDIWELKTMEDFAQIDISEPNLDLAGPQEVTVTYKGMSKTFTIYVYAEPVHPTAIKLNKSTTTITSGNSETLYIEEWVPANTTERGIEWVVTSTNPPSLGVTVDPDGKVTVGSNVTVTGTAIITARSTDVVTVSASCTVTVVAAPIPVTGVTINSRSGGFSVYVNETLQLIAAVTPNNATNTNITWSSLHPNRASVNAQGMVTGLTPVIGIPLPFFSYGGSSLLGFTILLFIFLRIDSGRKEEY